jgi:hypothetical protein
MLEVAPLVGILCLALMFIRARDFLMTLAS